MNQTEIGKFLSGIRKSKGYTQKQLADMLSISDKTVSKWECGNGLPEISLLMPLCEILGITVNELLSAKHLSDNEYKEKAEENIMKLIDERQHNKEKAVLTVAVGVISFVSFMVIMMIVGMYENVISLPVKIVLIAVAAAIMISGVIIAGKNERTIGYYKCASCGHKFVPGAKAYIFSEHIFTTRKLRCPECQKKTWCKKVLSSDD